MIIQKLEKEYLLDEIFSKLNQRAILLESNLIDKENEYVVIILNRLNELFKVYMQSTQKSEMKSQLFILEIAIQELCMILEKIINK